MRVENTGGGLCSWCLGIYSRGTGHFGKVLTRRLILFTLGTGITDEYKEHHSLDGHAQCWSLAPHQRLSQPATWASSLELPKLLLLETEQG